MHLLLMAIDRTASLTGDLAQITVKEAKAHHAKVVVLCCVPDDGQLLPIRLSLTASESSELIHTEPAKDGQNNAEQVVRCALSHLFLAGIEAEGRVCSGDPANIITQEARQLDASMIIMGRRHLSSLNRLIQGSVSKAVLESSPCPVLIVPCCQSI